MKKPILTIAMVALLMVGTQAFGEMCATDNVPAATLLIPYFSVAYDACDSALPTGTTFFNITNASDSPVIAHVTVWTDWSIPEIDFDIFLTGYDVQSFDMRNLFCEDLNGSGAPGGDLPVTWWGAFTPGLLSNPGTNPTNCGTTPGQPPRYSDGAIVPAFVDHLRAVFAGDPDNQGLCHGSDDGTWHGYVTIDANQGCSLDFPSQTAYWTSGVTYNDETGNVLMGDYQYLDVAGRTSEGFTMVHIEAFAAIAAGPGPSFYSRYVGSGGDGREPLPTTWAARYNSNGAVDSTEFQIWRTGGAATSQMSCSSNPWALCNGTDQCDGLSLAYAVAFDTDEQITIATGGPSGGPAQAEVCVNWETQSLDTFEDLDTGFNNGWYYLNLQTPSNTVGVDCTDGQAYLTVTQQLDVGGVFSGGWDGIALDGSCTQFAAGVTVIPAQPTAVTP